ncbi:MAG: hypothetical protein PHX39_11925 [Bacteroidales bacterium]|nr:hypothetical protein [Bacteroidales bacterium]
MSEIDVVATEMPGYILGLPWFIWVFVVLGVIILLSNALWVWYWYTMGPVGEYWQAIRKSKTLGILLTKGGKLRFVATEYVAGIMRSLDLKLSWMIRSPDAWQLGTVPSKVLIDMWGIGADPRLLVAVKTAIGTYNEEHPDAKIETYKDLYEKIKHKEIDDPILIPAVCEVPIYEIERYLPHVGAGDLEGHIAVRVAEEVDDLKGKEWPAWMKAFVLIEMAVIAFGGIIYLLGS